jgi:N-methylhydantoinase B
MRRGELDGDIIRIVLANIRVAEERIGDIKAQLGALTTGARRLTLLLDRYGRGTVDRAIAELRRRSERMMRAQIESIPDGRYESVAYLDSDGVVNEPLEIRLAVEVEGAKLSFDFSGSSPPCAGPMNSVWATTLSSVYVAMKHIFPEIPINAGCFAPIMVKPPKGTFLFAEYPRPVAGCAAEVAQRIIEAVFLALAQAIPERLFAAPAGTSGNFSLGGYDPEEQRNYVMYFFSGGGYGGWWAGDGLSNGCSTIGISKTQPIEVLEQRYPLLFEKYALREGSGGAGKFRGGFGVSYRVKLLRGEAKASFLMEHGRFGPPGLLGGKAGAPNAIRLRQNNEEWVPEHLSKGEGYLLKAGDHLAVDTPGGGGYGEPKDRAPELIEHDHRAGYFPQDR